MGRIDMFTVDVYRGEDVRLGALIAIQSRLYVPGWNLLPGLKKMVEQHKVQPHHAVAIGSLDGEPITVGVVASTTMAFCRKKCRRRGYGAKTIKAIGPKRATDDHRAGEGINGSATFWKSLGVRVFCYRGFD